jgi:SAM-dependent methyltransferase
MTTTETRRWSPKITLVDGKVTPWDIGGPQPVLVALDDAGLIGGEVLDAGCGLGDNSIFLASRGHRVTGVDEVQRALDEGARRAAAKGVHVEFTRADVTSLEGFEDRFDTVVDSALYHCLTAENQQRYVAALHRAGKPGAKLHLFCFADEGPELFPVMQRVSEQNLRETFGPLWNITTLQLVWYKTALTPGGVDHAPAAADPAEPVELDEEGRIKARVWQLTAERID